MFTLTSGHCLLNKPEHAYHSWNLYRCVKPVPQCRTFACLCSDSHPLSVSLMVEDMIWIMQKNTSLGIISPGLNCNLEPMLITSGGKWAEITRGQTPAGTSGCMGSFSLHINESRRVFHTKCGVVSGMKRNSGKAHTTVFCKHSPKIKPLIISVPVPMLEGWVCTSRVFCFKEEVLCKSCLFYPFCVSIWDSIQVVLKEAWYVPSNLIYCNILKR